MECMIELGSEALEIKIPEGCESGSVRCNGLDNEERVVPPQMLWRA